MPWNSKLLMHIFKEVFSWKFEIFEKEYAWRNILSPFLFQHPLPFPLPATLTTSRRKQGTWNVAQKEKENNEFLTYMPVSKKNINFKIMRYLKITYTTSVMSFFKVKSFLNMELCNWAIYSVFYWNKTFGRIFKDT